jgi:hypothetical protein
MNDFDLESKLRSVPMPERTEDYWSDFPARVRLQLPKERREFAPRNVWRPRLQWAGGLALALALMWVGERYQPLQAASQAITRHEQQIRTQLARLEAGVRILVFNPHGMGYLLAEANY